MRVIFRSFSTSAFNSAKETFQQFKKSPVVRETLKGDEKKTQEAYKKYCASLKAVKIWKKTQGGNPGKMV